MGEYCIINSQRIYRKIDNRNCKLLLLVRNDNGNRTNKISHCTKMIGLYHQMDVKKRICPWLSWSTIYSLYKCHLCLNRLSLYVQCHNWSLNSRCWCNSISCHTVTKDVLPEEKKGEIPDNLPGPCHWLPPPFPAECKTKSAGLCSPNGYHICICSEEG